MNVKATSGDVCHTNISMKTDLANMHPCRICSGRDADMTNIFNKDYDIVDRILFCTGIQFTNENGLPQHICNNCLKDLSIAHRFKTSCMLADNSFQKITKIGIKTEENGDEGCNIDDNLGSEQDEIVLKEEGNVERVCEDVKLEGTLEESNTEWDLSTCTKQRKRGPYKKNGKLKQNKKDEQPKVKRKGVSRGPYKTKAEAKAVAEAEAGVEAEAGAEAEAGVEAEAEDKLKSKWSAKRPLTDTRTGQPHCWVCEICGQQFQHRGSLSTHTRSHFPPAHACALCSYRAAHKYDLTKHQRIHAGERPFQCDMCPASFYDASNMNSHIRRNHQKQMNFRCEVCGRGFYDRSKLNRHVDSHNNIKRHECGQCRSAFTRLSYLKTHLRKRHGVELPPLRPGPQRRNLIVDLPPVEYVKPTPIAVKQDSAPT